MIDRSHREDVLELPVRSLDVGQVLVEGDRVENSHRFLARRDDVLPFDLLLLLKRFAFGEGERAFGTDRVAVVTSTVVLAQNPFRGLDNLVARLQSPSTHS